MSEIRECDPVIYSDDNYKLQSWGCGKRKVQLGRKVGGGPPSFPTSFSFFSFHIYLSPNQLVLPPTLGTPHAVSAYVIQGGSCRKKLDFLILEQDFVHASSAVMLMYEMIRLHKQVLQNLKPLSYQSSFLFLPASDLIR